MKLAQAKLLYRLVSHNQRLADRRHPMFEKNRVMKVMIYIFLAFWAVYLMLFGVLFYDAFRDGNREAYDTLNSGIIFILALDFLLRFGMQETPAQEIKPYKLLPIPQSFLIDLFLMRMGLRAYNFFWFFFFVPFGVLAIGLSPYYGWFGLLGYLIGVWLTFVANSMWYLLWRTFVGQHILYILIPLAVYAGLIYFGVIEGDWLIFASMRYMRGFIEWSPLSFVIIFSFIGLMFAVNRKLQQRYIYFELAKVEHITKVRSTQMKWLDRFGQIGEYMKLEVKSTMRNKVVKKQFIIGVSYMLILCLFFAFTDVYDSMPFMKSFICMYCFSCLGTMTLTGVMCMEGNYIDLLMSRKESVLALLKAKYYFNCIILIVPLLFTFIPVVEGKILWQEALASMLFSSGVVFPFLFQLAVYNSTTLHLNDKMTRGGRSTKMQMLMSSLALFVPMGIMYVLVTVLRPEVGALIMIGLGALGTALHPLWLRNIYRRFMLRRYDNMAGFRESR